MHSAQRQLCMEHGAQSQPCTSTGTPKETHRELRVAVAMASGLLGLIGVVVEGSTEEAGLYLVTLPPHDVGTAGTCPILHGAPGGDHPVLLSVLLSLCVFIHSYFHLCPHPSISGDRDPSLSPSNPAPIFPQPHPHPSLPPCVTPSPVPTLTPTLSLQALCCAPPVVVGSPEVAGAGPAAPQVIAQTPELGLQ